MGFVGSLFGTKNGNSGGAGLNYRADQANIQNPTDMSQIGSAYGQAQQGLGMQKDLYTQLAAQNGIGNQSSVFGQQQGLANLLGMQALGYGPNPALQQLQNTTGQNVANQSALMAGQRGSSANAGLMARQAAQQGGSIQQQAVGQGALMRAQQQIAAQQALQQQQAQMASLAGQQVGQQSNALSNYNQFGQTEQNQLLNAFSNFNSAKVGAQDSVNKANASVSNTAAQGQQGLFGGAIKGISGTGALAGAQGGMVPHMASGGMPHFEYANGPLDFQSRAPELQPSPAQQQTAEGPSSFSGKMLSGPEQISSSSSSSGMVGGGPNPGAAALESGMAGLGSGMIKGIMKLAPMAAMALNRGGPVVGEQLASKGKMVPGNASVGGNSLKNDTVPAMLSPKEIVIPRSITLSKDAPEKAKQFVAAVLARNGMRK